MSSAVLIVGSGGYIGGGITRAFRQAGYKVYGVIRNEQKKHDLLQNEITPVIGDITNPESYKDKILESSIIIDAAGVGDASRKFFEYVLELKKTKLSTYRAMYIFTSGIMTYYPGYFNESLTPVDETFNPIPSGEEMVPRKKLEDDILSTTDLRTVVIRPGFIYGGHGGVIAQLFFDVDPSNKELCIIGRPDKRWSWVHVDDLGDAYVKIAKAGHVVDSQLFNIAAQDNPTYLELKVAGAKAAGWQGSNFTYTAVTNPRQKNWETNVIINPQKAYDLVGWKPKHVGVLNEIGTYYASWKVAQNKAEGSS